MEKSVLTFVEYNIAGNVLRAYYDADGKLVFVLDSTLDDRKPNTLLVINPVGNRKWDDILANDYGVDLETVRPKKNNKYQKLDIEYSGLSEYDNLINAYKNGQDLTSALGALAVFREESVRRAAAERLAVAEANAEKSRETIVKTKESITELQLRLRQLRAKLSQQKKQIGREPTKKSASKILRTDAQIDATNEKLRRAKKRLDNAQRRLIVADEDAEMAREILARDNVVADKISKVEEHNDIMIPQPSDVVPVANESVAAVSNNEPVLKSIPDFSDEIEEPEEYEENVDFDEEPKAEIMAEETKKDEEVKPLFDKDPEILDEEIAFKPIEFGVSSPVASDSISESRDIYGEVVEDKPLSFTPPVDSKPTNVSPVTEQRTDDSVVKNMTNNTSILDTMKSVEMPSSMNQQEYAKLDSELTGSADDNFVPDNNMNTQAPVMPQPASQPVKPVTESAAARPVPPAATLSAAARPVSPITGTVAPTNPAPRKPTLVYYIMLILLIGLSIFTLWLYQKNTSDKSPDLTAMVPTTEEVAPKEVEEGTESPFMPVLETPVVEENVETVETQITVPAPVAEPAPVVEEEKVVVAEPEPVVEPAPVVEEEPAPVADVVVEPVASVPAEPVVEEPAPVVPTEEEILASKPSYNVSQNEKMFVASSDYDTETVYNAPSDNTADLPMCPDGTAPDVNGCCAGEVYTDMGEMGFNCCPQEGGDCFPPLI